MKSKPERTPLHPQRLKSRSHRCCRTIHLSYTLVAQTFPSSVWEVVLLHILYSGNLYYCTFCTVGTCIIAHFVQWELVLLHILYSGNLYYCTFCTDIPLCGNLHYCIFSTVRTCLIAQFVHKCPTILDILK